MTPRRSPPNGGTRRRPVLGAALAAMLASACGAGSRPGAAPPRAAQDDPPTPSMAGEAAARPATLPVPRSLRLAVRLDTQYALVAGAERRARETIDTASATLRAQAGLQLSVSSLERFAHGGPTTDVLRLLEAIERDPAPEADLTVLFSAMPAPRPVRAEHVGARDGGRAIVVRSLALYFDPADQTALAAAEAHLLLEGLGTALGALPLCGDPVMTGRFPPPATPAAFGPGNARLLSALAVPGGLVDAAGGLRPGPDAIRAIRAVLAGLPEGERRCARLAIDRRDAVLAAAVAPPPTPPPMAPAPPDETAAEAFVRCRAPADARPGGEAARCAGMAAYTLGRRDDAVRYLRGWLAAHDDDAEALLALARTVGRGGDDGAARGLLADFVARHPESVDVWLNLGVAEARLGRVDAARRAWQRVLELRPDHPEARALIGKLPRPE
ncbi:tetratricopeptide repeat protein [Myxococcota bacterium]|nr:tetratricopeptide repeat protein [Myxococcota bacterium]